MPRSCYLLLACAFAFRAQAMECGWIPDPMPCRAEGCVWDRESGACKAPTSKPDSCAMVSDPGPCRTEGCVWVYGACDCDRTFDFDRCRTEGCAWKSGACKPTCTVTARPDGYDLTNCDTSGTEKTEDQCTVTCAAPYKGYATATCGASGQSFFFTGCVGWCRRPDLWCTHSGSTFTDTVDCDGDGVADLQCSDDQGLHGVISYSAGCSDTWPTGSCQATCTVPTASGYDTSNAGGTVTISGFSPRGVTCAAGYTGTVTYTVCGSAGTAYTVSGCHCSNMGGTDCSPVQCKPQRLVTDPDLLLSSIDQNGNEDGIRFVMATFGAESSFEVDIDALMKACDENVDGNLNLEEVRKAIQALQKGCPGYTECTCITPTQASSCQKCFDQTGGLGPWCAQTPSLCADDLFFTTCSGGFIKDREDCPTTAPTLAPWQASECDTIPNLGPCRMQGCVWEYGGCECDETLDFDWCRAEGCAWKSGACKAPMAYEDRRSPARAQFYSLHSHEDGMQSTATEDGGDGSGMGVMVALSVLVVVLGLCVIGLIALLFRCLRKTDNTVVISSEVGKVHAVMEKKPTDWNSQNVVAVVGTPLPQEGNAMCAV